MNKNAPIHTPQWRIPQSTKDIIEEHVAKMLKLGIISPQSSPWCSPVVLVKKKPVPGDKSGKVKYRLVIDFRRINDCTRKERYPIPQIVETVENVAGHGCYTVLDSKSAYHQIPLENESKPITAFHTTSGSYVFNRLPFGLSNSSYSYQQMINTLLKGKIGKFAAVYLDDVCIYTPDVTTHLERMEEVLKTFKQAGLKIGLEKCQFGRREIKFLGHIINKDGCKPDPKNIEAMKNYPRPTSVKKVRQFIGCCGYYRRFIEHFSEIAAPITELTKKNVKFKWGEEQEAAFQELRARMCEAPVLVAPNFTKEFIIHTDASNKAIGAVLNQKTDGIEQPIAFHSRKLRGAELSYSITEKEALSVIDAVKHFHPYVLGRKFGIVTDHTALQYVFKFKNSKNARLNRWALTLSEYEYTLQYRDGAMHVVPDALSRNPPEEDVVLAMNDNGNDEVNVNINDTNEVINVFSKETLREYQLRDPFWGDLLRLLEGDVAVDSSNVKFATDPHFFVEDGVLYKRCSLKKPKRLADVIVVPTDLIPHALQMSHDITLSAHQGYAKTYKRAISKFFWLNMVKDVNHYVKTCLPCQKRKNQGNVVAEMGDFDEISRPLQRVGVDLCELNVSHEGHRYVLTVVDHFTRFVAAYPLKRKNTEEVTRAFVQYVTTYGAMEQVVSDRGSEFISELFQSVCKRLQTESHLTTAFHPSANGLCERYNGVLKNTIKGLSINDKHSWDETLPFAILAINTSYQRVVEEIPYYLFFGRDAYLPYASALKPTSVDYSAGENYAAEMTARMFVAFEIVKEKSAAEHEKSVKKQAEKAKNDNISAGSIVLLRNEAQRTETGIEWPNKYEGPFRVMHRTKTNAVIKDMRKKAPEQNVHLGRLKLAFLREDGFTWGDVVENESQEHEVLQTNMPEAENLSEEPQIGRYNLRRRR